MMKIGVVLYPAIVLLLAVTACSTLPDDYEGEPNVYAVLCADSLQARVMVGRTVSVGDTLKQAVVYDTFWYDDTFVVHQYMVFPWNGVSEADVALKQGQQSFVLTENPDSAGHYSDSIQSSPGQTWELAITYPTGEEIEARTTIPASFEITSPLGDTLFAADTLEWGSSSGACGYSVRLLAWMIWEEEDTVIVDSSFSYPVLVSGELNSMPMEELLSYIWGGDSAVIFISALDTNAYDYRYYGMSAYWDNLRPDDYMHIPGAWGVFGAQTTVRSRTYIIQPDTTYPSH
jgi:hypothetical protein